MKSVLILENSSDQLASKLGVDKNTAYLLEGTFTHLGIKNRNQRVYTAEKFLPHINELMERKRNLHVIYGELDHPESFEISLERASHVIENLRYDSSKNTVVGEIKVLSQGKGQLIRGLIDDGLPVFVSSRAAGITESDGSVTVKKLVTYDAVGDPGFFGTDMKRKGILNESLGYDASSESKVLILDISESAAFDQVVNRSGEQKSFAVAKEQTDFIQRELDVMRQWVLENAKTSSTSEVKQVLEKYEEMAEQKDRLEKYTKHIYKKLQITTEALVNLERKTEAITKYYDEISRDLDSTIKAQSLIEEKVNVIVESTDEITDVVNENLGDDSKVVEGVRKYTNHLYEASKENTQKINELVDYQDELRNGVAIAISELDKKTIANNKSVKVFETFLTTIENKINELISTTNENSEKINNTETTITNLTNWTNYIAENTEASLVSAKRLSKGTNHIVEYIDTIIAPKVNAVLEHQTILTKKINENIAIAANLTEDVVILKEHSNHITQISESIINHSDKLSKLTNDVINHVDYVVEGFNETRVTIRESVNAEMNVVKGFSDFSGNQPLFESDEYTEDELPFDPTMEDEEDEDEIEGMSKVRVPLNDEIQEGSCDIDTNMTDDEEEFEFEDMEEDEEDFEFEDMDIEDEDITMESDNLEEIEEEIDMDKDIEEIEEGTEDTHDMSDEDMFDDELVADTDDNMSDEDMFDDDDEDMFDDDIEEDFTGLTESFNDIDSLEDLPEGEAIVKPELEIGTYTKVLSSGKIGVVQTMESANTWGVDVNGEIKIYNVSELQPLNKRKEALVSRVEEAIQEFKKREIASKTEDPHFFLFLHDSDIASYNALPVNEKETIMMKLDEAKGYYSNRDQVLGLIRMAISDVTETNEQALVRCMPEDIKLIWESMDYTSKDAVLKTSNLFPLSNDISRVNFWKSRNLNNTEKQSRKLITENNANPENEQLSQEYIELFKENLAKRSR